MPLMASLPSHWVRDSKTSLIAYKKKGAPHRLHLFSCGNANYILLMPANNAWLFPLPRDEGNLSALLIWTRFYPAK
jgi:hypothetical protein